MNFSDSEIVASIYLETDTTQLKLRRKRFGFGKYLFYSGQSRTNHLNGKNTIETHQSKMKVGVLGCMAERLKESILGRRKNC
jgi:hypothetical protein